MYINTWRADSWSSRRPWDAVSGFIVKFADMNCHVRCMNKSEYIWRGTTGRETDDSMDAGARARFGHAHRAGTIPIHEDAACFHRYKNFLWANVAVERSERLVCFLVSCKALSIRTGLGFWFLPSIASARQETRSCAVLNVRRSRATL